MVAQLKEEITNIYDNTKQNKNRTFEPVDFLLQFLDRLLGVLGAGLGFL